MERAKSTGDVERNSNGDVESVTFYVSVHGANVLTISHDIFKHSGFSSDIQECKPEEEKQWLIIGFPTVTLKHKVLLFILHLQ